MTRYDELRTAFSDYTDRTRAYIRENESFARAIVYGFGEYAEMPKIYEMPSSGITEKRTYLPVYSIDENGETKREKTLQDAITHKSDGQFNFGFGVTLERQEGAFPKHTALFKVDCRRSRNLVNVDLAGTHLECRFNGVGQPDVSNVHYAIFDMLTDWMSWELGDGKGTPKFGFQVGP